MLRPRCRRCSVVSGRGGSSGHVGSSQHRSLRLQKATTMMILSMGTVPMLLMTRPTRLTKHSKQRWR